MSRVRAIVKGLAEIAASLLVLPCVVWFAVVSRMAPGSRDRTMRGLSQALALAPGTPGSLLRCAFYRRTMLAVGKPCHIGFGTIFATADVRIGNRVYIGAFCNLAHVDIDEDVLIGSNVTILSGKHQHGFERIDIPMNRQPGRLRRVSVGRDCWLGNGSIVMDDVPAGCIVAAGAVVTRPPDPYSIVGGNPARVIETRDERGELA